MSQKRDSLLPSSFFMARSKFVIQAQALSGKSISDVLRDANNMLIANSRSGMFVTLFSGLLHYPKREAVYSNGGPYLPLLFREDENGLGSLEVMSMALGLAGDMRCPGFLHRWCHRRQE